MDMNREAIEINHTELLANIGGRIKKQIIKYKITLIDQPISIPERINMKMKSIKHNLKIVLIVIVVVAWRNPIEVMKLMIRTFQWIVTIKMILLIMTQEKTKHTVVRKLMTIANNIQRAAKVIMTIGKGN